MTSKNVNENKPLKKLLLLMELLLKQIIKFVKEKYSNNYKN